MHSLRIQDYFELFILIFKALKKKNFNKTLCKVSFKRILNWPEQLRLENPIKFWNTVCIHNRCWSWTFSVNRKLLRSGGVEGTDTRALKSSARRHREIYVYLLRRTSASRREPHCAIIEVTLRGKHGLRRAKVPSGTTKRLRQRACFGGFDSIYDFVWERGRLHNPVVIPETKSRRRRRSHG